MAEHGAAALRAYLLRVDALLESPATIIIVGGGAIALAHDERYATLDLDTFETAGEREVWRAVEALKDAPDAIPIAEVTVGDAPHGYPDRLERLELEGARKLTVLIPEAHDLAVMKALRASEHDLAGIEAIHRSRGLSLETFLDRVWECAHAIGEPGRLRLNLLLTIERVFGEPAADTAEVALKTWPDGPR